MESDDDMCLIDDGSDVMSSIRRCKTVEGYLRDDGKIDDIQVHESRLEIDSIIGDLLWKLS